MIKFNLDKIIFYDEFSGQNPTVPSLRIYKKGNKTLIYCMVKRNSKMSRSFLDYVYDNYQIDASVIEYEENKKMPLSKIEHEAVYAALKSCALKKPVIYADKGFGFNVYKKMIKKNPENLILCQVNTIAMLLRQSISYNLEEAVFEFNKRARSNGFPIANINAVKQFLDSEYKTDKLGIYDINKEARRDLGLRLNTFLAELNHDVRDVFFLGKIQDALSAYDNIIVIANIGRYIAHSCVLADAFGDYVQTVDFDDTTVGRELDLKSLFCTQ